jgi:hypothetical protein
MRIKTKFDFFRVLLATAAIAAQAVEPIVERIASMRHREEGDIHIHSW